MYPDAHVALLARRRRTVLRSRAALAEALAHQDDTDGEMAAAARAIWRETDRAADTAMGDAAVEAFAAWLPAGRRRLSEAEGAGDHAVARVALARVALTLARTALVAAEAVDHEPGRDEPSWQGGRHDAMTVDA